jgi:DNA-binding NarL/FixJ family response regulator
MNLRAGRSTMHVLIADDHKSIRENLRWLLKEQQPRWRLSEAANGQEALKFFRKTSPDVAVLDIVMAPMGGIAAAYEIRRTHPGTKIIFISNHYDQREGSVVMRSLGVAAFVPKADLVRLLVPTIKRLLAPSG